MKKTHLLAGLGIGLASVAIASVAYASTSGYSAWRSAMGERGNRATEVVTEKNFDQFTNMHRLMADGKYTEAQAVKTELGLGQGRGNRGGGCGMTGGTGCGMRNGGTGTSFVDVNKNGVCDNMEQTTK